MSKRTLFMVLLMTTLVVVVAACASAPQAPQAPSNGLTEAQDKWAKAAQLGPYTLKDQDWKAIEEAAKKEGKVVVYSASSRIPDVAKSFEAKYGIKVEAFDLGHVDAVNKVKEEFKAGAHVGDVFHAGEPITTLNELVPKNMLFNFVPNDLVPVLQKKYQEPLLTQLVYLKVVIYNSELNKTSPVKNWWDLTKPEFKGKVQIKDIYESGENLALFATFVQHSDEMAAAYKDAFGKDIVLDKDVSNAGFQYIRNFLKNDPVFTGSDGDASKAVGTKGQKDAPLAIIDYAKYRDVYTGKLFFEPAADIKPVVGVFCPLYDVIISEAPHPNAAKLMVRWLMGDAKGGQGYEPFYVQGDYPTRSDVAVPEKALDYKDLEKKTWTLDAKWVYDNKAKVLDFWVANALRGAK